MRSRHRFRVLVGLLAIAPGCTNDGVSAADEALGESTDDTDEGADPTTDDTDDETTDGDGEAGDGGAGDEETGDEETGDEGVPQWGPFVVDEIAVDPEPVQRPTQGRWPAAGFDGNEYLAVWDDHRTRRSILYGGRVAADGTELDPLGFPILDMPTSPNEFYDEYHPIVAFDGVNFLVVTPKDGQILGVRVSAAGDVLDPGGFLIAEPGYATVMPSLVFDGEQYLVAWGDEGIYRARVQPDGTVLDPGGVLAYSVDSKTTVGLSFDGTNYLLSWQEDTQLESDVIMAGRMAPDGTLIDQVPVLITTIEETWFPFLPQPVAGFDGTNHILAWTENGENDQGEMYGVLAARVTPEGTVLDPDGLAIFTESIETTQVLRLAIAAGNGRSHVVWADEYGGEGGPAAGHVRFARVATDGTSSVYPYDTFARGLEPTVTAHPDGALLLWREGDDPSEDYPAITGVLLDGADLPVPNSVVAPASPASRQDVRAVASDGQSFFVLWLDTRDPLADGKALYGARIGAFGNPLDPEPILLHDHRTDLADVVFDGANYVVTWVHDSGGEGSGEPFRTVRVSPTGELLDIVPIVSGLRAHERILAGASDGMNTLLVGADNHYNVDFDIELGAVLLNQDGDLVTDIIPILINSPSDSLQASVSFDGLGYLVVWCDDNDVGIFGQRISEAGELEDEIFSVLDKEVSHVASAAGAGIHVVVWEEDSGIWATRVSPGGQVLDPGGLLVVASDVGLSKCERDAELWTGACASVAFDGQNFIIAWRAPSMLGDWSSLDLYAVQLSPDGEVSSQVELSQGPEGEGPPFLASAGDGRVLAAYSRYVPGPPYDTRRAMGRLVLP